MGQEVWRNYYAKHGNRRMFPDEDVCRFLGSLPYGKRDQLTGVDFGCGDGRNGQAMRGFFPNTHLVGIDLYLEGLHSKPANQAYYTELWRNFDELVNSLDFFVDCMTSQHFSWESHGKYFKKVHELLKPGGWFFLKHLDFNCTDTYLPGGLKDWTWLNIGCSENNVLHEACFPDNGLVCMPPHQELALSLHLNGLIGTKSYVVQRKEPTRIFSHSVFFCRKAQA